MAPRDNARLEAFSDGVFSIAITLLALDLKVPALSPMASAGDLATALAKQWPAYVSFVSSFFTILVMWMNHHRLCRMLGRPDMWFQLANGLLLLLVTATPMPTSMLATYLLGPAAGFAAACYGGFYVAVSLAFQLLWFSMAWRRRLLRPDVSEKIVRVVTLRFLMGLPLYAMSAVVGFLSPYATIAICTGLWIVWATLTEGSEPNP